MSTFTIAQSVYDASDGVSCSSRTFFAQPNFLQYVALFASRYVLNTVQSMNIYACLWKAWGEDFRFTDSHKEGLGRTIFYSSTLCACSCCALAMQERESLFSSFFILHYSLKRDFKKNEQRSVVVFEKEKPQMAYYDGKYMYCSTEWAIKKA